MFGPAMTVLVAQLRAYREKAPPHETSNTASDVQIGTYLINSPPETRDAVL